MIELNKRLIADNPASPPRSQSHTRKLSDERPRVNSKPS
jgi:hypothetical protein